MAALLTTSLLRQALAGCPSGGRRTSPAARTGQPLPHKGVSLGRRQRYAEPARASLEAITGVIDSVLGVAGSIAAFLALSVAADATLDKQEGRVGKLTNAETSDGTRFYVSTPPDGRPAPCVVLIHQFFGIRQREVELCDELARQGFVAVAPDTFNGQSTGWVPRAISLVWDAALRPGGQWGRQALESVIREIESDPRVNQSHAPVIAGFCYGGGAALRFAATHPGEVSAVAVFYGSPIHNMGGLEGPVFGVYGSADTQFPAAVVDRFEADLRAASINARILRFKGQPHAFVKDLAEIRRGGPAGQAWGAFMLFLHEQTARSAAPISDDSRDDPSSGGGHSVPVAMALSGHKRASYGHTGRLRTLGSRISRMRR